MEPLVPSVTLGEGWHEVFLPGPGGTSQDFDDIEDVMLKKYIGDRKFYATVMAVAVPIMIQNAITNFVGMLDNIMVGQVGTAQMSGVAIVNQLLFVFNLCIFGAVSGVGIFTAQFAGSQDHVGVRHTFRFKILVCLLLTALGTALFLLAGEPLIRLYLKGEGKVQDAGLFLGYGMDYLKVMLFGLLPFALANAYSGTLRETGQTLVPMAAGIGAVLVNLVLNYILIFGHFGVRAMGVRGAALATVVSRYVELAIVALWTHTHGEKEPFIRGAFRSMFIPKQLTGPTLPAPSGTYSAFPSWPWATPLAFSSARSWGRGSQRKRCAVRTGSSLLFPWCFAWALGLRWRRSPEFSPRFTIRRIRCEAWLPASSASALCLCPSAPTPMRPISPSGPVGRPW